MFGGGFEHFFSGGETPFGGSSGPVDNKKLYNALGLSPGCSTKDIKKAWRKAALEHHPDKGGDVQAFQLAQKAYEVLSDPEKREIYDKYGEEAINGQNGGGGGGGMEDILKSFFGGGQRGPRGPPRGEDVGVRFPCTLEDLYLGATKEVDWKRRVVCDTCDGVGGPPEAKSECHLCNGQGFVTRMVQTGPFIQQQRRQCGRCEGQGYSIKKSMRCKSCAGEGIREEKKKLRFEIVPGMRDEEQIKISEEGDKLSPDMIPGDVVIVLQQQKHAIFERRDDHLVYSQKISLLESLTGFCFSVKHLDGRVLRMTSNEGEVYAPGTVKVVSDEGMPTYRQPLMKGNLVIKFEVEFPDVLHVGQTQYKTLSSLLPKGNYEHPRFSGDKGVKGDVVDVMLGEVRGDPFRSHTRAHREEEDEEHGERVQCQTQ